MRKNIRPAIISLGWVTGVTERLDLAAENANIGSQVMPILIVALVALGAWLAIGVMLGSAVVLEQHTRKKQAHWTRDSQRREPTSNCRLPRYELVPL